MVIENIEDYATTNEIPMSFKIYSGDAGTHTHSFVEISYIISGSTQHRLNGGPVKNLQPGDAILIMPSVPHEFIKSKKQECTHRDIIIRESFFKEVCEYIDPSLYGKFLNGEAHYYISLSATKLNYLEHTINIINQMLTTTIKQKTAIIRAFAVSLLEPFLTYDAENHFKEFPSWFKQLLANFNIIQFQQQGLKKILEPFNYDKKYLCRVFKKYMGITMTDYLNHVRLDYAMNLIQNTNKNILTIAQELGFSSVSYFNIVFKKRYGITPTTARRKK